jgi:hypothetical protein
MKLNFCLALASLLFLASCSKTHLHIVNQGYSNEQINVLTKRLSKLDVKVVQSNISIPKAFPTSTITTNPNFTDIELLKRIESIVFASGIDNPAHLTFAQGKHFYSINHLGLYLRNEKNIKPVMPAYLRTQFCEFSDATIMFSSDGKFILEYENSAYEDELAVANGRYTFDGINLQLAIKDEIAQSYVLKREMKNTHLGKRPADIYKPQRLFPDLKALNCEFLIIFMD